MKVRVVYTGPLRRLVGVHREEVELRSLSVRGLLEELIKTYGDEFKWSLLDPETSKVRCYINISVNGKCIHHLKGLETELCYGDEVALLPVIAGG